MSGNNKDFENEYDSLKDVTEFQNNMFNPGHYVGTGKTIPTISAPGNATLLAVLCFIAAVLFLAISGFFIFADMSFSSGGLIESETANRVISVVIMVAVAAIFSVFGFAYAKKAKRYYKAKAVMEKEPVAETVQDELWQRTCPNCGLVHDIDYPKCPKCKYDYLD